MDNNKEQMRDNDNNSYTHDCPGARRFIPSHTAQLGPHVQWLEGGIEGEGIQGERTDVVLTTWRETYKFGS